MFSPSTDWDFQFRNGVIGDLCRELVSTARSFVDNDPGSIFGYSMWRACLELEARFRDEQGIPLREAETIDHVILPALRTFAEAGGLFTENETTRSVLSDVLRALRELRIAISISHL